MSAVLTRDLVDHLRHTEAALADAEQTYDNHRSDASRAARNGDIATAREHDRAANAIDLGAYEDAVRAARTALRAVGPADRIILAIPDDVPRQLDLFGGLS